VSARTHAVSEGRPKASRPLVVLVGPSGRYEPYGGLSRYREATPRSGRDARQKSEFFVVPQPDVGFPASDHGGRTYPRGAFTGKEEPEHGHA
jgi:hypothetical protein